MQSKKKKEKEKECNKIIRAFINRPLNENKNKPEMIRK
jgi:hypothetical protein